ncbi:MAG TPA: glycosyltransferase family 2 protein [Actinomycetota bacterium]|nr:glycosyltransferase family 2 protein [Actinomycetota bacterium]
MPELTVVVPTKDRPRLLARALGSVLPQLGDGEVVVVDDGSTDENAGAVREACGGDRRIRLLRNPSSLGPSPARNRGVAAAEGRFLCILDDDNAWLPRKWPAQRALLERAGWAPDVIAVMSVRRVDAPELRPNDRPHVTEPERIAALDELMRRVSPRVFLTTFAMPRRLFEDLGGYDERMRWGEHTDLLIRAARVARFAGTAEIGVVEDKQHEEAHWRAGRNYAARVDGIRLLLEKHPEAFASSPRLRAAYLDVMGIAQVRSGDPRGAAATFREVLRTAPDPRRRLRAAGHLVSAMLRREPREAAAARGAR